MRDIHQLLESAPWRRQPQPQEDEEEASLPQEAKRLLGLCREALTFHQEGSPVRIAIETRISDILQAYREGRRAKPWHTCPAAAEAAALATAALHPDAARGSD